MIKLKTSTNQTFYLLIAGNVVILALIGFFVLRPVFGMLSKQTNEITKARSETTTAQQKVTQLKQLKDSYPAYEVAYGPIVQNLPRTKDTGGYQTELEDLAELTSNQLLLIDTSGKGAQAGSNSGSQAAAPAQTVGGFPAVPVTLDMTGTFASVLDFVNRVETMDRFTRVTSLDIKADSTGAVKASMELQTLYFPN